MFIRASTGRAVDSLLSRLTGSRPNQFTTTDQTPRVGLSTNSQTMSMATMVPMKGRK